MIQKKATIWSVYAGVNGASGGGFSNMDVNDIFSLGDIFGDSDNIFGSMFGNQEEVEDEKAVAI